MITPATTHLKISLSVKMPRLLCSWFWAPAKLKLSKSLDIGQFVLCVFVDRDIGTEQAWRTVKDLLYGKNSSIFLGGSPLVISNRQDGVKQLSRG